MCPELLTPSIIAAEAFTDAIAAVGRLEEIYERNTQFLRDHFKAYASGEALAARVRANYPFVRITTSTHVRLDSRLAFVIFGVGQRPELLANPDPFATSQWRNENTNRQQARTYSPDASSTGEMTNGPGVSDAPGPFFLPCR
jgi:hypothetical protein